MAEFASLNISLEIAGTGDSIEAASQNASSAIRSASHKSAGATLGWDENIEAARNQAILKFLGQTSVRAWEQRAN
jgi:hypothetical protein